VNVIKDPDATLDYAFEWGDWLAPDETITSHQVIVQDVTLDSDNRSGSTVVAWLSGGDGRVAYATCRVTTNEGRTDDRTLVLQLKER